MSDITITTGARLHFGPLSYAPGAGRHFGGCGMMIDSPGVRLIARPAGRDEVIGSEAVAGRVRQFLDNARRQSPADRQPPPCRLEVVRTIPEHAGLGSGTQLAMAAARALALLAQDDADLLTLARRVGRGARSALGIHGFERGGFLVDGGKRSDEAIGAVVARVEVPADWRMLLVTPPGDGGLSGAAERDAFARLPAMPAATTDRLCRLVLMDILPALVEADCPACGETLYEFGRIVGDYFAPVQGDTYAHPQMARLVKHLRGQGVPGVGQTSWGPTLFVLREHPQSAADLRAALSADPRWTGCRFHIAAPLNSATTITHNPTV